MLSHNINMHCQKEKIAQNGGNKTLPRITEPAVKNTIPKPNGLKNERPKLRGKYYLINKQRYQGII